MERCAHCKGENAALYESGLLICLKCVALQEAKAKKDHSASVHEVLVRDLTEATLSAESAATEFSAVTSDIPSFIPPPDGAQRIRNVSHQLADARNAMMKAQHRLNEFYRAGRPEAERLAASSASPLRRTLKAFDSLVPI